VPTTTRKDHRVPDIHLVPFTVEEAVMVLEDRRAADWADGYPTPGDIEMANLVAAGTKRPVTGDFPWSVYSVIVADRDLVVGGAGFHSEPDASATVEIGYGIAEEFRGLGLATAAVDRIVDSARQHGARQVVAGTDPDNIPSQRVLVKAGFTRTEDEGEEWRWVLALKT
jgi:ribosomal protein S18 acetylase RimI-like enzyme